LAHYQLYIKDSTGKGRGIYTDGPLEADIVVEEAPVIVMSAVDRKLLDQTLLHDYIFEWQPDGANMCCMALGWVPVFNHSYASNCEYFMNYEDRTMSIRTVRAIADGEELTINYNGDWNDERPVWFDVVL
jgi:uncharacterized protein